MGKYTAFPTRVVSEIEGDVMHLFVQPQLRNREKLKRQSLTTTNDGGSRLSVAFRVGIRNLVADSPEMGAFGVDGAKK
ncbi:unnamed protein product, partial [Sphenostylis stenocarpa]